MIETSVKCGNEEAENESFAAYDNFDIIASVLFLCQRVIAKQTSIN